jgi:hypothetical protein
MRGGAGSGRGSEWQGSEPVRAGFCVAAAGSAAEEAGQGRAGSGRGAEWQGSGPVETGICVARAGSGAEEAGLCGRDQGVVVSGRAQAQ